jgi:hypothetical protein
VSVTSEVNAIIKETQARLSALGIFVEFTSASSRGPREGLPAPQTEIAIPSTASGVERDAAGAEHTPEAPTG